MNALKIILLIIAFLPGLAGAAQERVVTGKVRDAGGEPLGGVLVRSGSNHVLSDDKGNFTLSVAGSKVAVTASLTGYKSRTVTLKPGQKSIEIVMSEDPRMLSAVQVVGKTAERNLREGALNVDAINIKAMAASVHDLSSVVDRSTGIKIRREGGVGSDYDLSINGLSGNSVRYFIDGVPLDTKGQDVRLDNIPVNTVSRVEIYKGVVPASLSADALGGAVNIVTNRNMRNYLDASYTAGSFCTQGADISGQIGLGKTAIVVRPSVSFNYSKNNYMMKGIEVWNEDAGRYEHADRRRFHDDYLSLLANLEAGVRNVSWADHFFVGGSFSKVRKEIQTGAMQNKVYGEAERRSQAWNIFANYAKGFGPVHLQATLSHTWSRSKTIDKALRKYSWDGTWLPSSGNEINNRAPSIRVYERPLTLATMAADYSFNASHMLSVNYSMNHIGNKRSDEIDTSFEPSDDSMTKHIAALTYTQTLLDARMSNIFFIKDYVNSASIRQNDNPSQSGASQLEERDYTKNYVGGGLGTSFRIINPAGIKASFEHSVRLPLSRELLGNGVTILPNLALKPESSNNLNIGVFGAISSGDHAFTYEAGYFMRFVKDYIRASVSEREGLMQYENVPAVHIHGVDVELGYSWRNALRISLNGSYSDARDQRKYKTDGKPSATYRNRVPNKPWLFANAEASYTFRDLISKQDKLRIGFIYQWIHWYFLNWEAYGALESKARIPEQNICTLQLTYSLKKDRYSISLECDNLFDATVYDNYMLQKPGRSFTAKFRIFIN